MASTDFLNHAWGSGGTWKTLCGRYIMELPTGEGWTSTKPVLCLLCLRQLWFTSGQKTG